MLSPHLSPHRAGKAEFCAHNSEDDSALFGVLLASYWRLTATNPSPEPKVNQVENFRLLATCEKLDNIQGGAKAAGGWHGTLRQTRGINS